MRILFVAPRFHTNQYQLVKTLQEKNHEVFFHVASVGFTEDHSLVTPVRYNQCRLSRIIERLVGQGGVNRPNYFPNPLKYWSVFKRLKPAIVVIREPYRYFSLLAAICGFFMQSKIVFYTQEDLYRRINIKTFVKRSLLLRVFRAAWMTPMLGERNGKNKKLKYMYHVPIPITIKPIAPVNKILTDQRPGILMVGKYHQDRKNHLLFLKTIHILKERYNFNVTIVGECIREQQVQKFCRFKELVDEFGLSEVVELKRNVPFVKMPELYASHHLFVLPARDEQYGVSVTEAMGFGLPAICTDTCGARYNIINGENGLVVRSDSLEELTHAMETLLASKEKLAEMSKRSLAYAMNHLSGDAFYTKFSFMLKDRFQLYEFD